MFPVNDLVPMLKRYAFEHQNGIGPPTWVVDAFIDINVPFESLFAVLESMFYANEAPFQGRNRAYVANDLLHVVRLWVQQTTRDNGMVLGSVENAAAVSQALQMLLQQGGLDRDKREECQILRTRLENSVR
jgi:nuclear pore complex protein Nup155